CMSNQQCSDENGQLPYICKTKGGDCVPLLSKECAKVVGDSNDDNPLLVGGLFRPNSMLPYQAAVVLGAELALDEITKNLVGIPIGANGTRRPLVMIECDSENDALIPAKHLVNDIGVPAIIGPLTDQQVIDVALNVAVPKGTMMLTPSVASPAVVEV